jgi:hypothetical protein
MLVTGHTIWIVIWFIHLYFTATRDYNAVTNVHAVAHIESACCSLHWPLLDSSSQQWIFLCFHAHVLAGWWLSDNSRLSAATDWLQSQSHIMSGRQSVGQSVFVPSPFSGPRPDFYYCQAVVILSVCGLWWEDGFVICCSHSQQYMLISFYVS